MSQILYPVIVVALGYLLARFGNGVDERPFAAACAYIFIPALLFRQAFGQHPEGELFFPISVFYVCHTAILFLAALAIRFWLPSFRELFSTVLLNLFVTSLLGLRILQNESAVSIQSSQAMNVTVFNHSIIFSTLCAVLAKTGVRFPKRAFSFLATPLFYAIFAGAALAFLRISLPTYLLYPVDKITLAAIPLSLLLAGVYIGRTRPSELAAALKEYAPALTAVLLLRLVVSPAAAWVVLSAMEIPEAAVTRSLVLAAGLPAGVFACALALIFSGKREAEFTLLCVILTSAASVATIPAIKLIFDWFPTDSL